MSGSRRSSGSARSATPDRIRSRDAIVRATGLELRAEEIDAGTHVIRNLLDELTTLREQEAAATVSGAA